MLSLKRPVDRIFFENQIKNSDKAFDKEANMIAGYLGANGYHTKLKNCRVHDIRGSFSYAYDLLRRNNEGDIERAYDILYRVIPLQDINPKSKTYGIWSYYSEEPLYEMDAPDFNWADFNGKTMLQILYYHSDKLTEDLKSRLKDSIYHACKAIIKRNVGPDYTNISVMGSYVTIIAGEMFNLVDVLAYGKERLNKLYEYNVKNGSFSEFNSPTYTFTALYDLSDFVIETKDEKCKEIGNALLDLVWDTLARHFHPATGQLAGPHYRAYSLLLEDYTKYSMEKGLNHEIDLMGDTNKLIEKNFSYDFSHELKCPEKYRKYFTGGCGETVLDQTFRPGTMAYTYMNDVYTLGSLSLLVAWNQHRNVLGYFGSVEKPIAFNLKCLHDNWDYCSALMGTIQDKNKVLTGFCFVTDFGDTHGVLDPVKNSTISAEDFRIRYIFSGATEELEAEKINEHLFNIRHAKTGVNIAIDFPYAVMDDYPINCEMTRENGELYIDLVLYKGERKDINFGIMKKAAAFVSLEVSLENMPEIKTEITDMGDFVRADFENLAVKVPYVPGTFGKYCVEHEVKLYRNGELKMPEF